MNQTEMGGRLVVPCNSAPCRKTPSKVDAGHGPQRGNSVASPVLQSSRGEYRHGGAIQFCAPSRARQQCGV